MKVDMKVLLEWLNGIYSKCGNGEVHFSEHDFEGINILRCILDKSDGSRYIFDITAEIPCDNGFNMRDFLSEYDAEKWRVHKCEIFYKDLLVGFTEKMGSEIISSSEIEELLYCPIVSEIDELGEIVEISFGLDTLVKSYSVSMGIMKIVLCDRYSISKDN